MKSMNVIIKPCPEGDLTGWFRNKPDVVVKGSTNSEVMKNLIVAYKIETAKEISEKEKK